MNNPTEEQIREFWEWCGFKLFTKVVVSGDGGERFYNMAYYPDRTTRMRPLIDLNNLFKYAVPKVYNMELIRLNRFEQEWQTAYRARVRLARKYWLSPVKDKDPALALFWALWQVKERE